MTQRERAEMADLRAESARKDEVYKRHIERLRNDRKAKQLDTLLIGIAVMMCGFGGAAFIYALASFGHWLNYGW